MEIMEQEEEAKDEKLANTKILTCTKCLLTAISDFVCADLSISWFLCVCVVCSRGDNKSTREKDTEATRSYTVQNVIYKKFTDTNR